MEEGKQFKSRIHGEGEILAYRSAPEKGAYRMDVRIRRPGGEIEVLENLCRCAWCCRSCVLQRVLSTLVAWYYIPGTQGKWVEV